jgi:DNA-binding response OmpR family regulator
MRILLIEDEKEISYLYTEILTGGGYQVISAFDGDEGIKIAQLGDWDVLLLDIMLPNKDGIEILKELNFLGLTDKKKVVILSNIENSEVLKQSENLGALKYVIKSEIKPQELLEIVTAL